MSFLAPLFLLGGLAIAAPILFHLIRRHTKKVIPFSSVMFLRPSPPRIHRRSRLENFWLLLLRCLALLLLALVFARPFLPREKAAENQGTQIRRAVALLDVSASMRREDLWQQAEKEISSYALELAPGDELAVLLFDRSTRALLTFDQWRQTPAKGRVALLQERLAGSKPTWSGTSLGPALLTAVELLEGNAPAPGIQRSIHVFSDLQEGSRLDGLQGFQWPKGLTVRLHPVKAAQTANASAAWTVGNEETDATAGQKLNLRVTNSADAKVDQYQLQRIESGTTTPTIANAYVPAGQTRTVRLDLDAKSPGQRIILTGDATDFDNTLYVTPPQTQKLHVLFLGSEDPAATGQSIFYLQRALSTVRQSDVELKVVRADQPLPTADLLQAQLLVLGEGVTAEQARAAREFAERGHVVLLPMVSEGSGNVLSAIAGAPVKVTEAETRQYALLAQIDFRHPLFAPFADPRFSDFTKIHFWKYRKVDPTPLANTVIPARYDSGDPAIIQVPLGKGALIAFTSSWRPADSQLALSSKFVPMLSTILEQSTHAPALKRQYFIGDEVELGTTEQPFEITLPNGAKVPVTEGRFGATEEPGFYTVQPGGLVFAVNQSPDESRLVPLTPERLTSLGVPIDRSADATAAPADSTKAPQLTAVELEQRQKLWRWLLVGAFVILLIETWLAGRLARPATATTQASS